MFIGHFAVGFAAKPAAPRVSLGTLFLATGFLDVIWPGFVLLGWERFRIDPGNTAVTPLDFEAYPFSHSLLTTVGWGLLFGGVHFLLKRDLRAAGLLAAVVASHWVLDWVSHGPDLPLSPGMELRTGLGLWNSVAATLAVESLLFAGGVLVYAKATAPRDRIGTWALWGLVALLAVSYLVNVFGPPPPSEGAVTAMAPALWLLIAWGYWIDRHRSARG